MVALVMAGAVAGILPAAAAGGAPPTDVAATLEAANKEGEVTISMHLNNALADVAKAFQAKYPSIKANYTLENVATFTPKVMTEQRNGEYLWDVLVAPTSNAVSCHGAGGGVSGFSAVRRQSRNRGRQQVAWRV